MDPMSPGEPVPVPESEHPWWKLRFSPPNPFYLLSAASFLHATGVWAQQQGRELSDAVRLGLICGYLLMMAVTSLVIVRLWKQWNDARSILLIVLLLFAELALTFDDAVLRDPPQGMLLLASGLAIAVVVSELLFFGLRMRFPVRFRMPYYVQLALVFLYPLVLVGPARGADRLALTERLYGYSWLAAASLLLLVPAIRRGSRGIETTGTPWKWPMYPWPAFVFLGLCLLARTYAQCLSFDSVSMLDMATAVNGLPSIFGPYFLSPFVLALAVLLLAIDAATGKRRFQWAAGAVLPLAAFLMSFPGGGGNLAYHQFVRTFTERWCGAPFLTLAVIGCGYGVAAIRRSQTGRIGLVLTLAVMSVVQPATVSLSTLHWLPHPLPLTLVTIGLAIFALRRRSSVGFALASTVATLSLQAAGVFQDQPVPEGVIVVHLVFAGLIAAGVLFRDRWTPVWRRLSAASLVVLGTTATVGVDESRAETLIYVMGLAVIGMALARAFKSADFTAAALIMGCLAEVNGVWLTYEMLSARFDWQGLPQFVLAFSLFLIGLHVSALKGGVLRRVGWGRTG